MKYIEVMREINKQVEGFDDIPFDDFMPYIQGVIEGYGIKLNSDLEVIQLIEIAKKYKINHI